MKIIPVSYDSFSTRSMATIVKTDINIFIDPSVAIGIYRYGLKPHRIELEELERKKEEIISLNKNIDIIIITHYHWDHCPHPNSKHFEILYNKKIFLKDINNKINNSQKVRGKRVIKKLENKSDLIFSDGKEFEINNTYIKFSEPLTHGGPESKLGFVLGVYIEYKNNSVIFASDIQGLYEDSLKFILSNNPKILIFSGPPYYIGWNENKEETFINNLKIIAERTNIKEIIIDHHSARDKKFLNNLNKYRDMLKEYNIEIKSAADLLGIENRLLEANRDILYKNDNI